MGVRYFLHQTFPPSNLPTSFINDYRSKNRVSDGLFGYSVGYMYVIAYFSSLTLGWRTNQFE
jgi:hypothetical protein